MTDDLARRYRRLLRLYPDEFLRARGEEMLGTYLDAAPADRTRPTLADTADVARGAAARWLRTTRTGDLPAGLRLAGVLALATAAGLAAFWLLRVELAPLPDNYRLQTRWGAFQSTTMLTWTAWLVACLSAAVAPKAFRACAVVALAATVTALPVAQAASVNEPPVFLLTSQVALGIAALAFPTRPSRRERLLPLLAVAIGAIAALAPSPWHAPTSYRLTEVVYDQLSILRWAALALAVAVAVLAAVDLASRRRSRGLWAAVLLSGPVLLVALRRVEATPSTLGVPESYWSGFAATAGLVAAGAACALIAAILWRDRRRTADG